MPGKTYAVIDSHCFTGSHIVDALLDNSDNQVVGINRSLEYRDLFLRYKRRANCNFRFFQIDLVRRFDQLANLFNEIKPQVVINVAALGDVAMSNEWPVDYFETNALGVAGICNHFRACSYPDRYIQYLLRGGTVYQRLW